MSIGNDIVEAIFDGWCDGKCGNIRKELPEVQEALDAFRERFHASTKDYLFIEKTIMELVCLYERNAFEQGFCLCLELLNGRLFDEGHKSSE